MIKYELIDVDRLEEVFKKIHSESFAPVVKKSTTQMFNRAWRNSPWDTGELAKSRQVRFNGPFNSEVGYTKEYAPHVEYGHRTRNGGYVQGKRFLKDNVDRQQKIFQHDVNKFVKEAIEK